MLKISSALENVKENIFEPILNLISQASSKGETLLNAGVGIPDSDTHPLVIEALKTAIEEKQNMRYGSFHGKDNLLFEIANYLKEDYNITVDYQTEIALLPGTKAGLSIISSLILEKDDLVILPTPSYPDYRAGIELAQANIYEVQTTSQENYLVDFDKIPKAIAQKAKIIFLNYPSNPTGAVANHQFFEKAIKWAKENDVFIIHDHAYADFYFDEGVSPCFYQNKNAKQVGIEYFSFSKNFSLSGLRIGFVIGNKEIIDAFKKYHTVFNANIYGAVQDAARVAIQNRKIITKDIKTTYSNRIKLFTTGLDKIGYQYFQPKGSIFIWVEVPENYTSKEFFEILLNEYQLVVIPGYAFGKCEKEHIRISISINEEQIKSVLNILEKIKNH